MTRQMSTGQRNLCGGTFGKRVITKHLEWCEQKKNGSEKPVSGTKTAKSFHLVVEGQ
jgi:hypothetical protein